MSISKDRKDRFTSQPDDFVILKPAPKNGGSKPKSKPAKKKQ